TADLVGAPRRLHPRTRRHPDDLRAMLTRQELRPRERRAGRVTLLRPATTNTHTLLIHTDGRGDLTGDVPQRLHVDAELTHQRARRRQLARQLLQRPTLLLGPLGGG